jgi:heat-inducible transcriptional repressor
MQLDNRAKQVLSHLVEAYIETGEPVGSKSLCSRLGLQISPATIRNVMADLEQMGFLYAPHTSAGRIPSDEGWRFFVQGLIEVGTLEDTDKMALTARSQGNGISLEQVLDKTVSTLSGLTACAGLVVAAKSETGFKHLEFIALNSRQALVVLVLENGLIENRLLELPDGVHTNHLQAASNYLNHHLSGKTLSEVRLILEKLKSQKKQDLDALTESLVEQGTALWSSDNEQSLIVRGQAHLLNDIPLNQDISRIRQLFEELEQQNICARLLQSLQNGDGVQIFIGRENPLFHDSNPNQKPSNQYYWGGGGDWSHAFKLQTGYSAG